jgi:hypothetical protein
MSASINQEAVRRLPPGLEIPGFTEPKKKRPQSAPLYSKADLPPPAAHNVSSMSYPTFMDDGAGDANFGTIGAHPTLFWVSIGHSPYTDGRRLWATPFNVSAA